MRDVVRTVADINRFAVGVASKLDGRPYYLTLKPFKRPKTAEQRALFHILVRDLATLSGYPEGELKDWFKAMYGPSKSIEFLGKQKIIAVSSEDWTLEQASIMIDHVYRVAAENGHALDEKGQKHG